MGWVGCGRCQEPTGSCRSYHVTVVDWQLSISTRGCLPLVQLADWYKGVVPLVRLIRDRSTAQWPMVIEQEKGELQKASEVTGKEMGKKGTLLKSALEATSSWIGNQVRLKAQLQEIQRVYIQKEPCAKNRILGYELLGYDIEQ